MQKPSDTTQTHYRVLDTLAPIAVLRQTPPRATKGLPVCTAAAVPPSRRVAVPVAQPSAETLRLYAADWRDFLRWCRAHRATALPASATTLAPYLLERAPGLSRGALGRRRAAIAAMHRQHGLPAPVLDGAAYAALRQAARPPAAPAAPATGAQLRQLAASCPRDLPGLRDRALFLLRATLMDGVSRATPLMGLQGATPLGLTWLLALDAEQVRFTEVGVELGVGPVTLPRTGTPLCPVQACEDWLRASDTSFGPVFRKIDRWGNVEHARLGPGAVRQLLLRHLARAGSGRRP